MGGNVFKDAKRFKAAEFKTLQSEIVKLLQGKGLRTEPLVVYRDKPSFGDLDLLTGLFEDNIESLKNLKKILREIGVTEFNFSDHHKQFKSGTHASFLYKNLQVDLIFVKPEHFGSAAFYFSYNDLNNFVGRIAHKLGVKFGWDGLSYVLKTEDGYLERRLELTTDPEEIYRFLGYDYERYLEGFDTLEEIFEFVTSSSYFNSSIFEYENLNHANRTRNRKRKNYAAFLEWLEGKEFENHVFLTPKALYLPRVLKTFPHILDELEESTQLMEQTHLIASKLNGNLVMEWTGLSGKDLGKVLREYTRVFRTAKEHNEFVLSNNRSEIKKDFMTWFSSQN